MSYDDIVDKMLSEPGVERSTIMKNPCLRYKGNFIAMIFEKEDALVIKVSPERVDELIDEGRGNEFNITGKKFKEWVVIPLDYENEYGAFMYEALEYAKQKG